MKLIEKLILDTASEEDLNLEQFVDELRANPDDWYAFRRAELDKFILLIFENVATLSNDASALTVDDLKQYFGLSNDLLDSPETPDNTNNNTESE